MHPFRILEGRSLSNDERDAFSSSSAKKLRAELEPAIAIARSLLTHTRHTCRVVVCMIKNPNEREAGVEMDDVMKTRDISCLMERKKLQRNRYLIIFAY